MAGFLYESFGPGNGEFFVIKSCLFFILSPWEWEVLVFCINAGFLAVDLE
jgi:hypothetical protein